MNILDLISRHGISLKRAASTHGGEYHGPCPGCGGDDRFHVWPEENQREGSYWCRQCGKGGDAIQFLIDFENLTFPEACDRLGRPLPDSKSLNRPRPPAEKPWHPRSLERPPDLWKQKAQAFVTWSYKNLFQNPEASDYLLSRGIKEETAGRYGLGWNLGDNGKDLYRAREGWGLPELKNDKGRDRPLWLPIGMVIPWYGPEGIRRIRIRRSGELEFGPRYYVIPGSSGGCMVLNPAAKVFIVIEAELDGILIIQEVSDLAGVVALGSSHTKPDQETAGILEKALHILVALDFDKAGATAWPWWKKHFPESERWPVPKGKDPGEAFNQGLNIRSWIMAGIPEGLRLT